MHSYVGSKVPYQPLALETEMQAPVVKNMGLTLLVRCHAGADVSQGPSTNRCGHGVLYSGRCLCASHGRREHHRERQWHHIPRRATPRQSHSLLITVITPSALLDNRVVQSANP